MSYVNGIVLSGIIKHIPDKEFKEALFQTGIIFVTMIGLGFVVHLSKVNIEPLYYFILLLASITLVMTMYYMFLDTSIRFKKNLRHAVVLLMSAYILLHTYQSLTKQYDDDVLAASLDYYTSVFSLYTNQLSISHEDIVHD
jgi:hypothetical protein